MNQLSADPQTPLGEPMTQDAASTRAQNPLKWHLDYWLNLYVIGVSRDENKCEMAIMIAGEQTSYNIDGNAADSIKKYINPIEWHDFKEIHSAVYSRYWESKPREDEEYQAYVRDLNRMLEDKEEKLTEYLRPKDNLYERIYLEQERMRSALHAWSH